MIGLTEARARQILLVDDSPGDVRLIREALRETAVAKELHVVTDGEDAMHFLRRAGRHATAPTPDLILLDLNLPRKDGREVLEEIKSDARLRRIPVIVLTTSQDERDVRTSYDLQANCYVPKPIDYDHFASVIAAIDTFWFTIVTLPTEQDP